MNKLLLIDGNSLTYRAYYGSAYGPAGILTNSKGTPINAISILNRMISKAILKYKPTHVFVAFDAGKKTIRHEKLESYKGGRSATPQELIVQFPLVKEMLTKMKIQWFQIPGIEADDIIATLVKRFSDENEVMVLSSDKDMYQLVAENVCVILPQNGSKEDKIMENNEFYMREGYRPDQVIDMKGLVGDTSDNLPGVKGVGAKGATKLLSQYDTLEGIYENIKDHSESLRLKLESSKDIAFLCKELATLDCEVDVPFDLKKIRYEEFSSEDIITFFEDLEIYSLAKKYKALLKSKKAVEKDEKNYNNLIL